MNNDSDYEFKDEGIYCLNLVIADNSFISKKYTFRILVNAGISGR
jgi:hypothetical protein